MNETTSTKELSIKKLLKNKREGITQIIWDEIKDSTGWKGGWQSGKVRGETEVEFSIGYWSRTPTTPIKGVWNKSCAAHAWTGEGGRLPKEVFDNQLGKTAFYSGEEAQEFLQEWYNEWKLKQIKAL